jgi:hypothetical protein
MESLSGLGQSAHHCMGVKIRRKTHRLLYVNTHSLLFLAGLVAGSIQYRGEEKEISQNHTYELSDRHVISLSSLRRMMREFAVFTVLRTDKFLLIFKEIVVTLKNVSVICRHG